MGDTVDREALLKKIDRQPRPSMAIASHNGLCEMSIDGHRLPQLTVRAIHRYPLWLYRLWANLSIYIVCDNGLWKVSIDRYCRQQLTCDD